MAGLLGSIAPEGVGLLQMAAAAPQSTTREEKSDRKDWRDSPIGRALHEIDVLHADGKITDQEYLERYKAIADQARALREKNSKERINLHEAVPDKR